MSETKFIEGDEVRCLAGGKYLGVNSGDKGRVTDVYTSKQTSEVVYEVTFGLHDLKLIREADLEAA